MRRASVKRLAPALLAAFLAVFLAYPLWSVLSAALVIDGRLSTHYLLLVFSDPRLLRFFLGSFNVAWMAALFAFLFSLPLVALLSGRDFRGKRIIQAWALLPIVLPPLVGALGIRRFLARFGVLNLCLLETGLITEPIDWLGAGGSMGVALTQGLHLFPIFYLNVSASLARVDRSAIEAARVSGASRRRILTRVLLPLVLPGLGGAAMLAFIASFADLGTPLIFGVRDLLPVAIYEYRSEVSDNPLGYSLVAVTLLLTVLLFLLGRFFLRANAGGGVGKGASILASRSSEGAAAGALVIAALSVLVLATIPHVMVVLLSVARAWSVSILPQDVSLATWLELPRHPLTISSIQVSLLLSLASTLLDLVLGTAAAYYLTRSRHRKTAAIVDALLMAPLAVPGIVLAFGYLSAFRGSMLDPRINPLPLLTVGYAIRRLPFMVRSAVAGFEHSDPTLEEAARVHGSSPARVWRRITLPLVWPHLAGGAVLCFAFSLLEVSESLLLALEERFYPITKAIYTLLTRPDGVMIAAALGTLSLVLVALSVSLAARLTGKDLGAILRGV